MSVRYTHVVNLFYSDDDFSLYLSASELEEEDDEGVPDLPAPLPDVNPPRQAAPTAASRPTGTAAFYGAAAARPLPRVPAGPRAPPKGTAGHQIVWNENISGHSC